MAQNDEVDIEKITGKRWEGSSLGYRIICEPDLSGHIIDDVNGEELALSSIPDFLKAAKRLDRMFRERYSG